MGSNLYQSHVKKPHNLVQHMRAHKKFIGIVVLFVACVIFIQSDKVQNWVIHNKIKSSTNLSEKITLINTTLSYDSNYWNSKYPTYALGADSETERRFLAGLLYKRFGEQSLFQIDSLLKSSISEEQRINAISVAEFIKKDSVAP